MRASWVTLILPLVSAVTVPISLSPGNAPSVSGNLVSLSIEQDREWFCVRVFIVNAYPRIQGGLIGSEMSLVIHFSSTRSIILVQFSYVPLWPS